MTHRLDVEDVMGAFYALDRGLGEQYVREAFNLGWGLGGDMGSDETLTRLAEIMGWPRRIIPDYRNPRSSATNCSSRSWCGQWPAFSYKETSALRKCASLPSSAGLDAQLSLP